MCNFKANWILRTAAVGIYSQFLILYPMFEKTKRQVFRLSLKELGYMIYFSDNIFANRV